MSWNPALFGIMATNGLPLEIRPTNEVVETIRLLVSSETIYQKVLEEKLYNLLAEKKSSFPHAQSLDAVNIYNQFSENEKAIQMLARSENPHAKIISTILLKRNRELAQSFLDRFSPTRTEQALHEKEKQFKSPEILKAQRQHKKNDDIIFKDHIEEINLFLQTRKQDVTSMFRKFLTRDPSMNPKPSGEKPPSPKPK
jgi:hypothetical protein